MSEDESERSPQYRHVLRYRRTLKRWKDANLGEGACHRLAAIEARKAFPLPNERQAEVDAWLDKKYPERKSTEGEIDYPPLDVPRAK